MDHDKIQCNCILRGNPYKAPEQHARSCPVSKHLAEVIAGTCADCKSVDESEGTR